MQEFDVNIGLEVHIQLNTESKAFCADSIQYGQEPNSQISEISLAYPGTLPKVNDAQIKKAVQLGLALNANIKEVNYFDRKSYFYPDLPKGYQITQDNAPYCVGGYLEIEINGEARRIAIHHIHMEEDAGKSIHQKGTDGTLVDLNRAGTPLLELVTEPTISSAEEAFIFLSELRALVRYLGISDGNMEEGSMRADCNVSLRLKGSNQLGERREVKNVNSLRFAKKAIEYEIKTQTAMLTRGEKVVQSTMDYDADRNITRPLREKEDAHDYRYFPDPDLPPLHLNSAYIADIRSTLPPNPWRLRDQLVEQYAITNTQAKVFAFQPELKDHFESIASKYASYSKLANLYTNKIIPLIQLKNISISELSLTQDQIIGFLELIDSNSISASIAFQKVFPAMVGSTNTAKEIAENMDLLISSEQEDELESILQEILDQNPDKVKSYQNGKKGLLGFFMGQAMRTSGGKLDPKTATEVLKRLLDPQ